MLNHRAQQRVCVIVPAYREETTIGRLVQNIREHVRDVVVVDDGSTDATADEARRAGACVLRHHRNMGKGAALDAGFRHVREEGFDYVVCLDGDGRHDPDDIPGFIEAYVRTGIPVLIGNRMSNPDTVPRLLRMANRVISWILCRATGQYVPDTQCGFRLYRCDVLPFIEARNKRCEAETEVLMHVIERKINIGAVPVTVTRHACSGAMHPARDIWRFLVVLWRHCRFVHGKHCEWWSGGVMPS